MEWFKLATKLPRDPKWRALSPQAKVLYIEWACEIAEQETDGIYHLAGRLPRGAKELESAGLIEPHVKGYYLPGYLKWNPTREEMENKRMAKAIAGAKGAASRWHSKPMAPAMRPGMAEVEESKSRGEEKELASLREAPKANTPSTTGTPTPLAQALLAPDSRAQYLLARLTDADARWDKITPAALMKFGRSYGPDVVITALGFLREEQPSPIEPFPYFESVCVRIQSERAS